LAALFESATALRLTFPFKRGMMLQGICAA